MKLTLEHGLLGLAIALPVGMSLAGFPKWGLGLFLGEILGAVNFIWVGLVIRRGLTRAPEKIRRNWLWHSLLRWLFIVALIMLAIRWPAANIWALLIGYSLIQFPAAALRALR